MGEGGRLWVAQMLGVGDNDHKAHKPLHTLARCGFGCLPRVAAVCVAKTPKARAGLEGQIRGRVARCGPSKSDVQAQMLLTRAAHMTSGDKQHALEKKGSPCRNGMAQIVRRQGMHGAEVQRQMYPPESTANRDKLSKKYT